MPDTTIQTADAGSQIIPVYFPESDKEINQLLKDELPGYAHNFLLLESIKAGYKAVIKKFKGKPAPTSFTDQVIEVVKLMPDEDITTESVKQHLLAANPSLAEDQTSGLENISKFLERVAERGIIRAAGTEGRKKIYRLVPQKPAKKRKSN